MFRFSGSFVSVVRAHLIRVCVFVRLQCVYTMPVRFVCYILRVYVGVQCVYTVPVHFVRYILCMCVYVCVYVLRPRPLLLLRRREVKTPVHFVRYMLCVCALRPCPLLLLRRRGVRKRRKTRCLWCTTTSTPCCLLRCELVCV